jgi:hypothetical protein
MFLHFHRNRVSERSFGTARIVRYQYSVAYFLVFLLLPYSCSVISRSIGKALPNDAFDRPFGTLHIVNTKADAIAIAEIELGKISVQVFLAAMLVDALHAALEDRIVAFNGVGVNFAANIFFAAVVYALMAGELGSNFKILTSFVGHQGGFLGDVGPDNRCNLRDSGTVDMEATGGTATLNEGQNCILVAPSGAAFWLSFLPSYEGFVGFHNFASTAHRLDTDNTHSLPQTVRHEPSGFQGNTQSPMELIAADALLAGAQQIHGLDPKPHWNMARFEYGPNLYGELFAALVALVQANPSRVSAHLADALGAAAMRADRAVRPHVGFNPGVSGGFVVEGVGFDDGFGHGGQFLFVNQSYRMALGLSTIISPL